MLAMVTGIGAALGLALARAQADLWPAYIVGLFVSVFGVVQLLAPGVGLSLPLSGANGDPPIAPQSQSLRDSTSAGALIRGEDEAHSAEVERLIHQLDVRHEGMLGLLLETLALRDPSAARHAAAVAHYAHEIARAAGMSEREQAVVHTAGLLHDLGKEALPDHILVGHNDLHPAERRLIERHPADGARLLLRVEGMGEVAAAVLAHHERIDGKGYPDGLSGDGIPMSARILAIAEVYDVLTAPDSYREAMSPAEAEDELRTVAGTQLDGRLVWLFATQVLRGRYTEHFGHIADLETELQ